ncbi:hypothetical protein BJ508DRAFT_321391 [Ascobolus immersus RN42]|uniref:Uncharacterized protein n=1 Tax=Ascobolus immersus RN42 TaxID=1160509 RepID=A0A3N4IRG3_ASCIM|nr:hypothetical protein BJ508DRAFT_321391 [Ascobolus immersus RN42]
MDAKTETIFIQRQSKEFIAHLQKDLVKVTAINEAPIPDRKPRIFLEVAPNHKTGAVCSMRACRFKDKLIKPGTYRFLLSPGTHCYDPENGLYSDERMHVECLERLLVLSAPGVNHRIFPPPPPGKSSYSGGLDIASRLVLESWRKEKIDSMIDQKREWNRQRLQKRRSITSDSSTVAGIAPIVGIKRRHSAMDLQEKDLVPGVIVAGNLNMMTDYWWAKQEGKTAESDSLIHTSGLIATSVCHELSNRLAALGIEKNFHFHAGPEDLKDGKTFEELQLEALKRLVKMFEDRNPGSLSSS